MGLFSNMLALGETELTFRGAMKLCSWLFGREHTSTPVRRLIITCDDNDPVRQLAIGSLFFAGEEVPQDYAEAARWFRKAAEQGNADAQKCLGNCYASGFGVVQDEKLAFEWYLKAAHLGHVAAQRSVAIRYGDGKVVPRDDKEAAMWFQRAADGGDASAQFNLGVSFHQGLGVPVDKAKAVYWLRQSASQGYEKATKALRALERVMDFGDDLPIKGRWQGSPTRATYQTRSGLLWCRT